MENRRAYNVLVLPYYIGEEEIEYCIFQRADIKIWQFIAGGGEGVEEPIEAAYRETYEESGIKDGKIEKLNTLTYMPTYYFPKIHERLAKYNIFVMPIYSFALEVKNKNNIKISKEHLDYKWVNYDEAMEYFHFDTDRTALWELASILRDKRIENIKSPRKASD